MAHPNTCNCISCHVARQQQHINAIHNQRINNVIYNASPWFKVNLMPPIFIDERLIYKALAIWLSISGHTIKNGYSINMTSDFIREVLQNDIIHDVDLRTNSIGFHFRIRHHGFKNPGIVIQPELETSTSAEIILLALAKEAGGSFKINRKYFTELLKDLSSKVEIDTEQDDEFVHVRIK